MNLNEYEPMREGVGRCYADAVSWTVLEKGLDRRHSRKRMKRALNKARRQGGKAALREDPYEAAAIVEDEPFEDRWKKYAGMECEEAYYNVDPAWYDVAWHRVDRIRDLLTELSGELACLNDLPAGLREDFLYVTREMLFSLRPC